MMMGNESHGAGWTTKLSVLWKNLLGLRTFERDRGLKLIC